MLSSLEMHPQSDHTLKVAVTRDAGEPHLLCGPLVLLAIPLGDPIGLLVKEIKGRLIVVRIITDPFYLNDALNVHKPLVLSGHLGIE